MKRTLFAAIAALSVLAAPSTAATIDVTQLHTNNIYRDANGQNPWTMRTSFDLGTESSGNVRAGAYRLTDANGGQGDFLAFSLEPLLAMITPTTYTFGGTLTNTVQSNLQALASNAWSKVRNRRTAAAFQMAVWEIVSETDSVFDIDDGYFQVTSDRRGSNRAERTAQRWLNKVQNNRWTSSDPDYLILSSQNSQNLVTNIQAVPLPASCMLLMGVVLGTGVLAHRKKSTKA